MTARQVQIPPMNFKLEKKSPRGLRCTKIYSKIHDPDALLTQIEASQNFDITEQLAARFQSLVPAFASCCGVLLQPVTAVTGRRFPQHNPLQRVGPRFYWITNLLQAASRFCCVLLRSTAATRRGIYGRCIQTSISLRVRLASRRLALAPLRHLAAI